jgi:Escherichia/Staphylococcus phage prohead protease
VTTFAAPAIPRFLERDVAFEQIRAEDSTVGDGRNFNGYAAVFNSLTRIDSWEGAFDEQIAKGAFKKSVRERMPVLQFDHGRSVTIGSIPIGAITKIGEDDRGLHVEARMHAAPLFEPLREAIGTKTINGMSFRFEVMREDWFFRGKRLTNPDDVLRHIWRDVPDMGNDYVVRTLKELKVPELGPVVFPAYPDTTASVRSREVITLMRTDESMVLQFRNSIARAMGAEATDEVPDDLTETPAEPSSENGDQPDSMNSEEEPTPVQGEPDSEEATSDAAPPEQGHPDDEAAPPAPGHPEPESDEGRSQEIAIRFTNLDDAERHLARQRIAESIRGRRKLANSKMEKYSNG